MQKVPLAKRVAPALLAYMERAGYGKDTRWVDTETYKGIIRGVMTLGEMDTVDPLTVQRDVEEIIASQIPLAERAAEYVMHNVVRKQIGTLYGNASKIPREHLQTGIEQSLTSIETSQGITSDCIECKDVYQILGPLVKSFNSEETIRRENQGVIRRKREAEHQAFRKSIGWNR